MAVRIIPSNTATAVERRVYFTLVDATDLVTPEDITVTGVKPEISVDGSALFTSTNDIVKVDGAAGEYYHELTQAEVDETAGSVIRGVLQPSGCALVKYEAHIAPAGLYSGTVALEDGGITAAKIATDAFTAVKFAADVTTELQNGLATAAALATVDTNVDTLVTRVPSTVPTAAQNHAAILDGFIAWLQDEGFTRPTSTGNATLKNSAGSGQTVAITTSASAEPIISAT